MPDTKTETPAERLARLNVAYLAAAQKDNDAHLLFATVLHTASADLERHTIAYESARDACAARNARAARASERDWQARRLAEVLGIPAPEAAQ